LRRALQTAIAIFNYNESQNTKQVEYEQMASKGLPKLRTAMLLSKLFRVQAGSAHVDRIEATRLENLIPNTAIGNGSKPGTLGFMLRTSLIATLEGGSIEIFWIRIQSDLIVLHWLENSHMPIHSEST
jgi:hypothetical protein